MTLVDIFYMTIIYENSTE